MLQLHGGIDGSVIFARSVIRVNKEEFSSLADLQRRLQQTENTCARLHERNQALEREIAARTAQLDEANRDMDSFAGSVAHDLRAPLRAIQNFSTILMEEAADQLNPTARNYLERIHASGVRMERLINDLMRYSRLLQSELTLEKVELETLAREVINSNPGFQAPAAEVKVASPLLPVTGNSVALRQCLANLISNAVKFVPRETRPQVQLRTEREDGHVKIWVEDNGIGIEKPYLQQIFKPFERLHGVTQYEGSGLGLAMVRKATERMGGQAGAESELGKGSRFWIQLPAAG